VPIKTKIKKRNKYLIYRQPLKVAQLYLNKSKLLLCLVVCETFMLLRYYARVQQAKGAKAISTGRQQQLRDQ
jgi:hypothetical protein